MNQETTSQLPVASFLCQEKQTTAYIRTRMAHWEPSVPGKYYLEYSYNRQHWYALNGRNPIEGSDPLLKNLAIPALFETGSDPLPVSIDLLHQLQARYGAPEPVVLTSIAAGADPARVTVSYSNGMSEERTVIWDDGSDSANQDPSDTSRNIQSPGTRPAGRIADCAYPAPLIRHRADPYIYKHTNGKYYFLASHTDAGHNLNGRYQYLYLLLRCADTLEDLTDNSGRYQERLIYEKAPILNGTGSPHIWAPELHMIHGRWYVYYTTTISDTSSWDIRPHVLECSGTDPMIDTWIERGPIRSVIENDIAFTDFSLDHTYLEINGCDYLLWAQKTDNISDIMIARLKNPWTIDTPAAVISHPQYSWELHGFAVNEGPAVLKRNGRIFVTFSASGTDAMYCLGLLWANENDDLLDPACWHKVPHPVFQSSPKNQIFGPGHNSFTRSSDDNEDLIVYHGRPEERYLGDDGYQPLYDAGRHTYIGKVFWDPDGFPNFSVPGASIAARPEDLILR